MSDKQQYWKEYASKNRSRLREMSKDYRERNRDKIREYNKKRYAEHKEEILENNRLRYDRVKNTERVRKYRQTESGKESARRSSKKYESLHPERRRAWDMAQRIPLLPCQVCGDSKSHRHHPDINKPLSVIFLCPAHHKEADGHMI